MNNVGSSPILNKVIFYKNSGYDGGGMKNTGSSSPFLSQVTFFENKATNHGGGIHSNTNDEGSGPIIVNSIFWGNSQATDRGARSQIYIYNDRNIIENVSIYNSVMEGGTSLHYRNSPTATNVNLITTNIIDTDPTLSIRKMELFPGSGLFEVPTISAGSSAIKKGLYIRRSGSTFYYI